MPRKNSNDGNNPSSKKGTRGRRGQQQQQNNTKEYNNGISFYDIDKVFEHDEIANESEYYTITTYPIAPHVNLDIAFANKDGVTDKAQLNMFGVCIRCRLVDKRDGGKFLAMPSYKYGDKYKDHVTIYNADMHKIINEVLTEIYG